MKLKYIFLSLFVLLFAEVASAQDKILDRKGNEYLVKVLEITPDSVLYRLSPDSANATTYAIPKAAIFMITYPNGVKELFQEEMQQPAKVEAPVLNNNELYNLGKVDAIKYYKPRGAYWATLGSTLLYPPVGLGVGAAIATSSPSRQNMETSDTRLLDNPHYVNGYKQQAKKQKLGKAAAGFGTAAGIYAGLFILLIAAMAQ
ncbi:hypothetical protein [Adhaeribacter terreus]|uniref:Uncharacterized protein n=1 Tax=Adhaeribacter terreus TaxID=529703 RepID=A0ABW0EBS0_9BACT